MYPYYIQYNNGPYVIINNTKIYIGLKHWLTGLFVKPDQAFMIDDPVLGTVCYDENGFRIIPSEPKEKEPTRQSEGTALCPDSFQSEPTQISLTP